MEKLARTQHWQSKFQASASIFRERVIAGNQMTGRSTAARMAHSGTQSMTDRITNPMNLIQLNLIQQPEQRPAQLLTILVLLLLAVGALSAQDAPPAPSPAASPATQAPAYTPKYHGDPARSDSESNALGYMRVVMRAQMLFNKQYGHYATSLTQLVHSGTFTQRMVNPERGDYTVGFKGKKESFVLTLTPKNLDAQHRSFYAEEDGKIHADETNAADGNSPVVESHHW